MDFKNKINYVLFIDGYVSEHKAAEEQRSRQGIALIAAVAFAVMSFLNIRESSYAMLVTTSVSAVFLLIGYFISKYAKKHVFLQIVFYIIFIVVFTMYTLRGGNDGFAILWLIIATYAVMLAIDFRAGFVISAYYLIMLLLVFTGPFSFLLQYDYDQTFMLRFPFLYAINFVFAIYIVIRVRTYQYKLLINKKELERLSTIDLSTGLLNRNSFIKYQESFSEMGVKELGIVFIDVNGLHEINNRKGHPEGDRALRTIADLCRQFFPDDPVYRMGGDEFLILCKNKEESHIAAEAQKLYEGVENIGYSISYGVAFQKKDFDLDRLVRDADEKMITFKRKYYESIDDEKARLIGRESRIHPYRQG